MYVKIGPYRNGIRSYKYLEKIEGLIGETRVDKAYDIVQPALDSTINRFLDRKRKIKVKVHPYDAWNAYETLSYIITPLLKELKNNKCDAAHIDDEDVPEELRSTFYPLSESDKERGMVDDKWHERWEWVISEMIWAFEQNTIDWETPFFEPNFSANKAAYDKHVERMNNGYRLFGKYFLSLWD